MEWPEEYDGVEEWATYGWARASGSFAEKHEFIRLTINKDPVGDAEYLGDRSLVSFILSESGAEWLYFSVYNYGFTGTEDSTNEYFKVEVTGYLYDWFYTYTAYSVAYQSAMCYVYMGPGDAPLEISH